MANALSMESAAPPPQPQQNAAGNAFAQGPQAAGGGPPPQQAPPLTHQQAVAALRHFDAIARELEHFLKDPDLGKVDIKDKVIEGTTKLVANRMIKPAEAVQQLGTFPADPIMQRKWVQEHFQSVVMAQNAVLDHHAASNPGTGDWAIEAEKSKSKPDTHMDDMASIMTHYKGGKRG